MSSVPDFFDSEDRSFGYLRNNDFYEETIYDVWNNCVKLSTVSIFYTLYKIILVNIVFSIILSTGRISLTIFHFLSGLSGLFLITTVQSTKGKIVILVFFLQSYFILKLGCLIKNKCDFFHISNRIKRQYLSSSNIVKYILITSLVLCEYFLLDAETWLEIRGIIMIFAMKLISLADDIENEIIDSPTFVRYFGYIFCGANIMFGPWISYGEYVMLYYRPAPKNIWWIFGILRALFIAIFFLTISNCWANFFISDDSNRWLIGYKEALSFRTSHYFICYLSEASMLAAGYRRYKIWPKRVPWRFSITDPLKIELPNSLTTVVTNWNKPMHEFLKRYIYKSWLPLGRFYGVLATFIASSFLHGFELKVSVVLITIGVFSYIQFAVRDEIAEAFNCCVRVYPCKLDCGHKYKRNNIMCRMFQVVCSSFTVLHLIYLGVLMDTSTNQIGIYEKWNRLYFVSFWIMILNMLIII